jgi:hypothetical protein
MTRRANVSNKLLSNQALTSSGNSRGIKVQAHDQLIAYLFVAAVSGTNPSLTLTVQSSPNNVKWTDLGSASALIAAGNRTIRETNFGPWVRLKWVITGTNNPTFSGTDLILHNKGAQ